MALTPSVRGPLQQLGPVGMQGPRYPGKIKGVEAWITLVEAKAPSGHQVELGRSEPIGQGWVLGAIGSSWGVGLELQQWEEASATARLIRGTGFRAPLAGGKAPAATVLSWGQCNSSP